MGLKDNFSQAFKELTNPKEAKDQGKTEIKDVASYMNDTEEEAVQTQPVEEAQTVTEKEETPVADQQFAQNAPQQDAPQSYQQAQSYQQTQNNDNAYNRQGYQQNAAPVAASPFGYSDNMRQDVSETTIISKNTIIDGNIRSFADMKIDGSIKGSVETTKNVSINGKVVGNITCDNAVMKSSSVQGNVTLKGQATMTSESMLIGDLTSQVATLNGKMKGNLTVAGKAQLDRDAVIFGDIKAGAISISDGAIVQGYISTTYLSQDESSNIFPESIAIGE